MTPSNEFVAGWGTLALINAAIASSKGHSALIWGLLSLLLGPITTFIIILLDNRPPKAR